MAMSLEKGKKLSLDKFQAQDLKVLRVEMTWDAPEKTSGSFGRSYDYDLDAIAFIIDKNKQAVDNYKHFCFFSQPNTPAIQSSGDDRNGDDGGEALLITLSNVPAEGVQIPIIVDLHKAKERKQNLAQMKAGKLVVLNDETNEALAEINMTQFSSNDTSFLFGFINRTPTGFEVESAPTGFSQSIGDWVNLYGIDLSK